MTIERALMMAKKSPSSLILSISGTTWDLISQGPITLSAGTQYTITNPSSTKTIQFAVLLWGAGGGNSVRTDMTVSYGGQGGFTAGTYTMNPSTNFYALAGYKGNGMQGDNYAGAGGGAASAIYSTSNTTIPYAVAGGGGGDCAIGAAGTVNGGKGGGTTGEQGFPQSGGARGGGGGTQSAGGSGGYGDRGYGSSGTYRNGGDGYTDYARGYLGGTGWGNGGTGWYKWSDGGQGGGGGGYYGGGGGGATSYGAAGGGGSGYIGVLTSSLISAETIQGVGTHPLRGTFGNSGTNGGIILYYPT